MCLVDGPADGVDLDFTSAFPAHSRAAVDRVLDVFPGPSAVAKGSFAVHVGDELLVVPQRIYNPEIDAEVLAAMDATERTVAACLYSRHHNGYVRQRNLEGFVDSSLDWVVPYVVALIGEYVVEILEVILERLDLATPASPDRRQYGAFVRANPAYVEKTAQRVRSYWNCYYRNYGITYSAGVRIDEAVPPSRRRYPGFTLIDQLRVAADDAHTPPTGTAGRPA